jgi:hypothetical protein
MTPHFLLEVGNSGKTIARGSMLRETLFRGNSTRNNNI